MSKQFNRANLTTGWPAAKYLPYAFWRAWFLIMYSSPLWLNFALPNAAAPTLQMHYVSTSCFVAASVLMAIFHVKTIDMLTSKGLMMLFGIAGSGGVLLEFAALSWWGTPENALFLAGAALTGLGTAPIALRAGQIYAAARLNTAIAGTLLSDVAAGLLFFFAIGTWPVFGLAIAAGLPLLAAVNLVAVSPAEGPGAAGKSAEGEGADDFETEAEAGSEAEVGNIDEAVLPVGQRGEASAGHVTAPWRPFVYFLMAAFLIGAVAFLQNSLGSSWFSQANIDSGSILGVSLLIVASLVLAVVFACVQSVRLEALYRPVILILSGCVLVAYLLNFGSPTAIGGTLAVYCLFSSYIWLLMAYLAHGRYFSPVQVFGYGRAVYAAGSLVGGLAGMYLLPSLDSAQSIPAIAIAMVAILLLCAVAIRPKDLASILANGEGEEAASSRAVQPPVAQGAAPVASAPVAGADAPASAPVAAANASAAGPAAASHSAAVPLVYPKTSPVALAADAHLSPRELEVFALMRAGRDAAYIADSLCVSRNTAKTHIRNIYGKFGVHTRQEFIDVMQGK